MSARHLIARGIGFSPGSVGFMPRLGLSGELWDGFPNVLETVGTGFPTGTTSHLVDVPAVQTGDLLVYYFLGVLGGEVIEPAAIDRILYETASTFIGLEEVTANQAARQENFQTTSPVTAAAQVMRIEAGTWGGDVRGVYINPVATGTSANPDPGNLAPPVGSRKWLWVAYTGAIRDDRIVTAAPANYEGLVSQTSGGGFNNGNTVGTAWRKLEAASEDPGTFTLNASQQWSALTIGIDPEAYIPPVGPVATGDAVSQAATADGTAHLAHKASGDALSQAATTDGTAHLVHRAAADAVSQLATAEGSASIRVKPRATGDAISQAATVEGFAHRARRATGDALSSSALTSSLAHLVHRANGNAVSQAAQTRGIVVVGDGWYPPPDGNESEETWQAVDDGGDETWTPVDTGDSEGWQ